MKKWLFFLPEIILIILSVYWFLDSFIPVGTINYIAFVLMVILALQLKIQNKIIGYTLATFILLLSLYLVLAVLSEFHEFPTVNEAAIKLLGFGLLLCLMLFLTSIALFYKYNNLKNN